MVPVRIAGPVFRLITRLSPQMASAGQRYQRGNKTVNGDGLCQEDPSPRSLTSRDRSLR